MASQPRVPVHARLPTLGERGVEAALQGPLRVTDVVGFVAKPGDEHTALIASTVLRGRRRGYAELEHGVAPGKSVRHSLGRRPKTVTHTWRKCLAQPPVAEAVSCTSEITARDAAWKPRGTGPARDKYRDGQHLRNEFGFTPRGAPQRGNPIAACTTMSSSSGSVFRSSSVEHARKTAAAEMP